MKTLASFSRRLGGGNPAGVEAERASPVAESG